MDEDRLRRHDLTDEEWARLEPLLPSHPRQGHRWNDHRLVIDGVFFRTRAGCSWRDLPGCYGKWQTVYNRHRRWPTFDKEACKQRSTVERTFGKLRQHRAVATRYDTRDYVWRGTIDVASIRIWLRDPVP
ncbi:MAG: transposase [Streptosporangiaceae bacterium]